MNPPPSSTPAIISALRILARDISSEDGIANAAIAEAADRLEEIDSDLTAIRAAAIRLRDCKGRFHTEQAALALYALL